MYYEDQISVLKSDINILKSALSQMEDLRESIDDLWSKYATLRSHVGTAYSIDASSGNGCDVKEFWDVFDSFYEYISNTIRERQDRLAVVEQLQRDSIVPEWTFR